MTKYFAMWGMLLVVFSINNSSILPVHFGVLVVMIFVAIGSKNSN
jgi:hypothetical protein